MVVPGIWRLDCLGPRTMPSQLTGWQLPQARFRTTHGPASLAALHLLPAVAFNDARQGVLCKNKSKEARMMFLVPCTSMENALKLREQTSESGGCMA